MKKNQMGIAHLMTLGVVIIVLAVGFVGYRVMQSNKDKKAVTAPTTTTNAAKTSVKPKELAWAEGGFAVKGTFADASVVKVSDNLYRLYYSIQPEVQGNNFEVYSATSSDGKTWTQESGTRKTHATFPEVIKLPDGRWRMYSQQAGVIKSAISNDGLSFNDEAGTRIDTANPDNLVFDNVAAPAVAQMADGTFVMVYRGTINTRYASNTPNPTTQILLWATSTDGLSFTKKGIAIDSRNSTLNGQLDGPNIVAWDGGIYKVFATSYTGVYQFSFDGKTFGAPSLAFAGEAKKTDAGFNGSPPGDPTTIKIGDTWFMYYGGPHEANGIHYATLQ